VSRYRAVPVKRLMLAASALGLLAACSSAPPDSTDSMCTDFAQFIHDGRPADQRADVVRSLGEVVANADQHVQDAYPALTRTVTADVGAQGIADDTFAQACFDAGWEG
jgi:hypothetical protein